MHVKYTNLEGKTFNDLTAIRYVRSDKGLGAVWLWKCICGNEKEYSAHNVKKGHTLSCGCRRSRDCKTIKNCKHCGNESDRFNRHGNPCTVCHACYNKQTNSFKYKNPKIWMIQTAKLRSKKQGIPFDLEEDDFEIPTHCPVFGMEMKPGVGKMSDISPSLDKIVPSVGYVKGNVAVISWKANRLKSNAAPKEIRRLADWMESQLTANIEVTA